MQHKVSAVGFCFKGWRYLRVSMFLCQGERRKWKLKIESGVMIAEGPKKPGKNGIKTKRAGVRISHSSTQRMCLWMRHKDEAAMVFVSVEQKVSQPPLLVLRNVGSGQQLQISSEALYSKIRKPSLQFSLATPLMTKTHALCCLCCRICKSSLVSGSNWGLGNRFD